ncbi:GH36-type glycosyl hydrolase domain-containing protein [Paenibacillus humicus]|uniref:GH36-type glycosyl hydrolase domain-containing protein n=1 Tax=Paenibacillus humicus TaxID=412861 RepID=UPI000FD941BA|nr:glucoamylase family protein [Paenibacillus humicus]
MTTTESYIQAARQLALTHDTARGRKASRQRKALAAQLRQLQEFAEELRADDCGCSQPAAEWLLDHSEFIEEQGYHASMELRHGGLAGLPYLRRSGHARVEAVCDGYLDASGGSYDRNSFVAFIQAYQEVAVLTIAETWSLPLALKTCLFRRLAEVFREVRQRHDACMGAERILKQALAGGRGPQALPLAEALDRAGRDIMLSGAVVAHLTSRLREWADDSEDVRRWLLLRLDNGTESLARLNAYEARLQARYQSEAGRLIGSLRAAERTSWEKELEDLSMADAMLKSEAAGTYSLMDAQSRATLRAGTARLAARLGLPESLVASCAVRLADAEAGKAGWPAADGDGQPGRGGLEGGAAPLSGKNAPGLGSRAGLRKKAEEKAYVELPLLPRTAYAAYYLLEPQGRRLLRREACRTAKARRLPENGLLRHRTSTYLALLAVLFAAAAAVLTIWAGEAGGLRAGGWVSAALLLAFPASEWAVVLLHGLIGKVMPTRPLLRYDFSTGIPPGADTMIVVPVIWSSIAEVKELVHRLELHYLANRDARFHFALLGDYPDAGSEHTELDKELEEAGAEGIRRLNRHYGAEGSTFHLLQRKRTWNEREGVWMGWERKRGKVVEFARLLEGDRQTGFSLSESDASVFPRIAYVITLDADTQLPIGSAQRMVGTMHLPYNRPRLNEKGTRVEEGYAVLQPRIAISRESAASSRLAALWAGNPGIDPYAFAVSDPYQDGVGQGIFTGKGIFDARLFRRLLADRIPDNAVLSHDLLEGGFLRSGLLSDIELVDGHPKTFRSWQLRLHRWVRGDWQLLCWLKPKVRDCSGTPRPVDLSAITRWQIVDNLRRSLLPPALYLLLVIGLLLPPGARWTLLAAAVLTACLPLLQALAAPGYLVRHPGQLKAAVLQASLSVLLLSYQAAMMADAVLRTLYRLNVSRKRLLEWTSAAETDRNSGGKLIAFRVPGTVLALLLPVVGWLSGAAAGWQAAAILAAAAWLAAPLLVVWLNGAPTVREERLSDADRDKLRSLAANIWAYYADYANAEDNWLPPDNVQLDPDKGAARRTSPTNIGLLLACTVTARDFGFISFEQMVDRISLTVDTLERMDRWHGHFFNWYDTGTLQPLYPRYVSTVDSGNLVAYLIAVRQGVLEWAHRESGDWPDGRARFHANIAAASDSMPFSDSSSTFKLESEPGVGSESGAEPEARAGSGISASVEKAVRLAERLEKMAAETDFRPLYDSEAQLLSLGYNADQNRRDDILYDLLASEARQASFLAIASGQLPVSHWFRLGRGLTRIGRNPALLSWSGTMFEYLMPALLMKTYRGSIWDSTFKAVVARQKEYARERGVPYGISESGYYAFDYDMNYQYKAFGVPGLGFQRGLEKELVLAPYAAIMALPWDIKAGMANLRRYEEIGAVGPYGFCEAVDMTASRLPEGDKHRVVRSFMAHHQGMSLLTLGNLLLERPMTERFHADPRVEAAELILQERIPEKAAVIAPQALKPGSARSAPAEDGRYIREFRHPVTDVPEVNVLSNGSFTTIVTAAGSGFIRSGGVNMTRWREDALTESHGPAVYIRDLTGGLFWSPSFYPVGSEGEGASASFGLDKAVFSRKEGGVAAVMEVFAAPEHPAEIRLIRLVNESREPRLLEITTYLELALAPPAVDDAHPAFSKLFVQTSYDGDTGALLAFRRPRSPEEKQVWGVHALIVDGDQSAPLEYETDRAKFIGRGHSLAAPRSAGERLSGTTGAVLDPAFVLRRKLTLQPGEQAVLQAVSGMSGSRGEALQMVRELRGIPRMDKAADLAWTLAGISLRQHRLQPADAAAMQTLAARLLYVPPLGRERAEAIRRNKSGQPGLWSMGISGDLPIMLLRIGDLSQLGFANRIIDGHGYLRRLGIASDLVLLNESSEGYQQELHHALSASVQAAVSYPPYSVGGGLYPLDAAKLSGESLDLLVASSRVALDAGGPSIGAQLRSRPQRTAGDDGVQAGETDSEVKEAGAGGWDEASLQTRRKACVTALPLAPEAGELQFFNGWGGFSADGSEYVIRLKPGEPLAVPWSNVIAGPSFGTLVTERGTGYTWWSNSREFKLSPWSNDPVLDPPGELAYVRDEESGCFWTAFPSPSDTREFRVAHGRGYSRFETAMEGLSQSISVSVHPSDSVKLTAVRLTNDSDRSRRLSVTGMCSWVLGVSRDSSASYIVTEWDEESGSLLARNAYQDTFREASAFLRISSDRTGNLDEDISFTANRKEFIGSGHTVYCPAGMGSAALSGDTGAFADSCGAVRLALTLAPGETRTVYLSLGAGASRQEALELAQRYRSPDSCSAVEPASAAFWKEKLEQTVVETPDKEMNLLMNGWLLYQALSCRVWARTAFFQAGGAYGFRDQLQDSMSLLHAMPELTRRQLLLNASHQYEEGDVQHWWHEETHKGIRTRYTDDLLWLPYASARYAVHTGDWDVFDDKAPFIASSPLGPEEHERYEATVLSGREGTLYEHCVRAIDKGLTSGRHGIPLMGIGDWNDGMNSVGDEGRGESVWLGWFLCVVLEKFSAVCERRGDELRAAHYRKERTRIAGAINEHAWDGEWFRRACTDEGAWLGSSRSAECRIDAIAQSWSVISGGAPPDRAAMAMRSFDRELVDRHLMLARLLTPAFDKTHPSPGYIQGYPPGLRENGAQYTHGVIWSIVAWAKLGQGDKAADLFRLLNPVSHAKSPGDVRRYGGEPYVMAADVYTTDIYGGKAGWTWYTGASGWMYQAGLEWILGLRREGDELIIEPCLPADWPSVSLTYRHGGSRTEIRVLNPHRLPASKSRATINGASPGPDDGRGARIRLLGNSGVQSVTIIMEQSEGEEGAVSVLN